MKPSEKQIGGDHYRNKKIQPKDYAMANDFNYFQTLILRYITRYKDKDGIEDLKKGRHTFDLLIEYEEQNGKEKGTEEASNTGHVKQKILKSGNN